jgi:hypothetical protein
MNVTLREVVLQPQTKKDHRMFEIVLIDRHLKKGRYEATLENVRSFGETPTEAICSLLNLFAQKLDVGVNNVQKHAKTRRFKVELTIKGFPSPREEALNMTFREFSLHLLQKGDKRIRGLPLFKGHLLVDMTDPSYSHIPESLRKFKTLGNVPLPELILHSVHDFFRIPGVSKKSIDALTDVLTDYQLALKSS